MLSNFSSNVILAKARAMYGRRLTKKNYSDLLNCQNVSEIARYLVNNTDYAKILSGINDRDIYRGQLENLLKQKLFEDSAVLCRYEFSVGDIFSGYLLQRSEIEQILNVLLHLTAGMPSEYLFSMPMFLTNRSRINLVSLSDAKSFDDILNALGGTPYRALLEPLRPQAGIPLDYTAVENALYTHLYGEVYAIIRRRTRGETKKQLLEIFDTFLDLTNYIRIIRLKTYFHSGYDFIRNSLLPFGTLRENQINDLIAAQGTPQIRQAMEQTSVGKRTRNIQHNFTDQISSRAIYHVCRHSIHFSSRPSVVMLSYIFLTQLELMDIINIVEGIRYKLPANEIKKLLTFADF